MNREHFYSIMNGEGTLDYELYLNTKALLSCQTKFDELCNADELQFQVVHQVEELWMKLIAYTLLDIDDYLQQENTNRVLTLFRRVHLIQRMMIQQIALLETMSPKEYQAIRTRLVKRQRPGIPPLSRAPQNVPTHLELLQIVLPRKTSAHGRKNLRFRIFPQRRLRGSRGPRGIRRPISKISLRTHAANPPHHRFRRQITKRPRRRNFGRRHAPKIFPRIMGNPRPDDRQMGRPIRPKTRPPGPPPLARK